MSCVHAVTRFGGDHPGEGGEEFPIGSMGRAGRVGAAERTEDHRTISIHGTRRKGKTAMMNAIRRFVMEEEGASAAEYALLVGLITVLMAAAVTGLGGAIITALNNATAAIS